MSQQRSGGIRAYAAHRKRQGLPGGTHSAVQRAIDSARLLGAVSRVDGRTVIDFEAADREWAESTTVYARPGMGFNFPRERTATDDDHPPVPLERLSVSVVDPGEIGIGAWFDLGNGRDEDPRDKFFVVDVAAARWLAGELLKCADAAEAAGA